MQTLHDTSCTSGATAQTWDIHFVDPYNYVHVETQAERYRRRANEAADLAVKYGVAGKIATAEICAELADELTRIAHMVDVVDPPPATLFTIQGNQ